MTGVLLGKGVPHPGRGDQGRHSQRLPVFPALDPDLWRRGYGGPLRCCTLAESLTGHKLMPVCRTQAGFTALMCLS